MGMNAAIVAVGTEFLLGAAEDTNSPWLAGELAALGFDVTSLRVVGDHEKRLEQALRDALRDHEAVVVTGGLGPTVDDVTRRVCAKVAGFPLVYREELALEIEAFFRKRNRPCPKANLNQAFTPQGAILVPNALGTAPGFVVKTGKAHLAVLPGVPSEMRPMFEGVVRPLLKALNPAGRVVRSRVYRTTGMPESQLNEVVRDLFEGSTNPSMAVAAHPEGVDIRLTACAEDEAKADRLLEALGKTVMGRLPNHVYGVNDDGLESIVGRLLRMRHLTVATAESCTGGLVARRLTSVPGSSDYFLRGYVTYSDASKTELLQVEEVLLRSRGAVSAEVAKAMALGCRVNAGSGVAVSLTGIAGPSGGTVEKPVGLVYTALADESGVQVFEQRFSGDRDTVQRKAAQAALELLRRHCLSLPLVDEGHPPR
jgi:nicotinamide-nucleotide amidase